MTDSDTTAPTDPIVRRHARLGWWMVAIFGVLGIVLESLNGFKVGWYLDVGNEARRTAFRLGHAHGTLFGLLNVIFALTVATVRPRPEAVRSAGTCLLVASTLLPLGFFGGGLRIYGGDPGLAIVLVPFGAVFLVVAAALVGRALR